MLVAAVALISYIVSLLWFRGWLYHGIFGPLPILSWFIVRDGEGSYLVTEIEMFVQVFVAAICVYVVLLSKSSSENT